MTATVLEIDLSLINSYKTSKSNKIANDIVNTYKKFVFATALRFVNDYDDADDITQEVFIKVLTSLHKFENKSSFKTWIYRITSNISINFLRKKKIRNFFSLNNSVSEQDFISSDLTPEERLDKKELDSIFRKAIASLPEKQRETFALRYFDDLTYEEISQMIGTSVGGLKANYHQAVKKITSYINQSNSEVIK